jgi:hypothetical protein
MTTRPTAITGDIAAGAKRTHLRPHLRRDVCNRTLLLPKRQRHDEFRLGDVSDLATFAGFAR